MMCWLTYLPKYDKKVEIFFVSIRLISDLWAVNAQVVCDLEIEYCSDCDFMHSNLEVYPHAVNYDLSIFSMSWSSEVST